MEKKPKNPFNLNFIHTVIIDFHSDHQKSVKLYSVSLDQLSMFDDENIKTDYEVRVNLVASIEGMKESLNEVLTNFFMSYYAFKLEAETNAEVMKEFEKLPPDFDDVKEFFLKLLAGYEEAVKMLKPIL